MTQDPFEEFEFKPITDGLGFHGKKKKAQIMASVDDNGTMTPSIPPKDTSAYS
ncbi:MAG: hypothetical protein NZ480_00975 [Bdellovibrionaceae bacterium]|nr:hypothetical protein [Pseudobdellovibrionaceae bacterium]